MTRAAMIRMAVRSSYIVEFKLVVHSKLLYTAAAPS